MVFDKILTAIFGSQNDRDIKALKPILAAVNAKEDWAKSLKDEDFPEETKKFKERLAKGETLDDILPEAFALVREAAFRVRGERSYDVQILGSIVLHSGRITEMKTGEGKTLVAVAPSYLNALEGKGVHIVTVNDYLAKRDADTMRPVFEFLGMSVGVVLASDPKDEAFASTRKAAYDCDVTYGTNNEFAWDYLRDNMGFRLNKIQRGFHYCIVDEIDSVLIDEARTPLIISGPVNEDTSKYYNVNKLVGDLKEVEKDKNTGDYPDQTLMTAEEREKIEGDYTIDEKSKNVSFTDKGMLHINDILHQHNIITGNLEDEENFEYTHYFTQALRAHLLFHNDVDYIVKDGQVELIDEFTGRILHGRRLSDGLHQAIEAKEHIKIASRSRTLASISFQNYFRMYKKLAGMTGTAATEAIEFNKIYKLDVVEIPTNLPVARIDENDEIYLNADDKWEAIANEIKAAHEKGQPILVGTVSVEKSEHLSKLLISKGIRHEVLNAKNHAREAMIIAEAGAKGAVTIATNMAGRGTDIKLGGNPEFRAKKRAGTNATLEEYKAALKIEKEKWKAEHDEVIALGGLYIIGTERHESRRIDNQLRGRSGRQGDPGRSKFYISMDDDLMRLFGGDRMKVMMTRIGMEPGEPIDHPWLNKGIAKAQQKVEDRNFDIRKRLLEFDDVLNQQRFMIYEQRDTIINDSKNLSTRVMNNAKEEVEDMFAEYEDALKHDKKSTAPFAELNRKLRDMFGFQLYDNSITKEAVIAFLQNNLTEKKTLNPNFDDFIFFIYMRVIEEKWLDQLETLDALREAVYLRSYSQKNPLTEYKIEGFDLFYEMIDSIRTKVITNVFRSPKLISPEFLNKLKALMESKNNNATAQHDSGNSYNQQAGGQAQGSSGSSGQAQVHAPANGYSGQVQGQRQNITIRRAVPKVGRNDPCPCGSGKKYKNCCGR